MRRERIELEGKGECEGGKRERRVEREGRDDGERDRDRERGRETIADMARRVIARARALIPIFMPAS